MMLVKEISGKGLMEQALVGIREQVPFIRDARIQTTLESKNNFVTKIEVFIKKHKSVIAVKRDSSPHQSIAKALNAILEQLEKIKGKNSRRGRNRLSLRDLQ